MSGGEGIKGISGNLKLNDIVNLNKTRDKDLATLNARNNKKVKKNVYGLSKGDNISDIKKVKLNMEKQICII